MKDKVVFIDRDGTINTSVPYLDNPDDFVFLDGVKEAIKLLNNNNFKVIVVTNQSGIGRAFFTENTLKKITEELVIQLEEFGAKIDGFYYCTHLPEEGCMCRKPRIGLLEMAKNNFSIDASKSFMIGDRISDVEAGINFGCNSILVLTGYGKSEKSYVQKKYGSKVRICSNLLDAVKYIV